MAFLAFAIISFSSISSAQSAYGEPIKKESYEISRSKVEREITYGNLFRDSFIIVNPRDGQLRVTAVASPESSNLIELDSSGIIVDAKNSTEIHFNIVARELGNYAGEIVLSGDVSERLPVNISVINESSSLEFFVSVETTKKVFVFKDNLDFIVKLQKLFGSETENITISYSIKKLGENSSHFISNETIDLQGSSQIRKTFPFPEELSEGFYILEVAVWHKDREALTSTEFQLRKPFWSITLLGFLPLWLLALIICILVVGIASFIFIERAIEKSKKYKMQLYTKTLPKKEERSLWLGRIAETKTPAYLDMDALTTHIVVAGATGGGKSIAAQTFIEELLLKNISVIVFDPTAQ